MVKGLITIPNKGGVKLPESSDPAKGFENYTKLTKIVKKKKIWTICLWLRV